MNFSADSLLALFGLMFLLSVVPGPSDLAVVARALSSGTAAVLPMIAGIVAADALFILLAAAGLALAAQVPGLIFALVQSACGLYVVWLGWQQYRLAGAATDLPQDPATHFRAGLFITLADPKAILFYMGLFPAFVQQGSLSWLDLAAVLLIATLVIVGVKLGYALLADRVAGRFLRSRARAWLERLAGGSLLLVGAWVLLQAWLPTGP